MNLTLTLTVSFYDEWILDFAFDGKSIPEWNGSGMMRMTEEVTWCLSRHTRVLATGVDPGGSL